jgi:hypothetical protein
MRPTKSIQEKRQRQVSYRLTDAEYLPLEAVAKQSGLRVNELARRLAVQGKPDAQQAAPPHAIADPAVIKRLDRMGANLNQLVKNAHIYKTVPPVVAELCEELRVIIKAAVLERVKE